MTLEEAFTEFISSEEFKDIAKRQDNAGTKLRNYVIRFKNGKLKYGAICELLLANGYTISADKKVSKKK